MNPAARATALWELLNAAHSLMDDLSPAYDQQLAESAMTHTRAAMEALAAIAAAAETEPEPESCEHGLSAWLCEGPNHYPADRGGF